MELQGKTALITGGTAGIGFAIAQLFAKNGANIIISYMHNTKRAQEAEEKLKKYGTRILLIQANSGNKKDIWNLFERAKEGGDIDILVNNVGSNIGDNDGKDDWEIAFQHHIVGTVESCDLFEKQGSKEGKVIINISSVAGIEPLLWYKVFRNESYCCLKSAINVFTKIRANAYDGKIRVVAIAPGNTLTEWWEWKNEEIIEQRIKWTLIKRFVFPKEIALTALHIVQNEAINGQVIVVDGGVVGKGYEK